MLKEYSDAAVVLVVVAWAGGLCLYDVRHRTLPDVLTIPVAIGIVVGSVAVGQPGWLLGGNDVGRDVSFIRVNLARCYRRRGY